jgi:hypothetical protein
MGPPFFFSRSFAPWRRSSKDRAASGCHSRVGPGFKGSSMQNPLAESAASDPEDRELVCQAQDGNREAHLSTCPNYFGLTKQIYYAILPRQ